MEKCCESPCEVLNICIALKGFINFQANAYPFCSKTVITDRQTAHDNEPANTAATARKPLNYQYCTTMTLLKEPTIQMEFTAKRRMFNDYLETAGNSIVVIEDDDIIKYHVHTNDPLEIVQRVMSSGYLIALEVDHLCEQQ